MRKIQMRRGSLHTHTQDSIRTMPRTCSRDGRVAADITERCGCHEACVLRHASTHEHNNNGHHRSRPQVNDPHPSRRLNLCDDNELTKKNRRTMPLLAQTRVVWVVVWVTSVLQTRTNGNAVSTTTKIDTPHTTPHIRTVGITHSTTCERN